MRAPSASALNLAQTMLGATIGGAVAEVPKPQSLPAITCSRPTMSANRPIRWAMRRNSVSLRCLDWLCRHEPRSGQPICKMKPASTTALYSSHRRGERVDIGILVLVGIDDKAGEDSGRGGGHECLGRRGFR